jgi:serine/threonine protein kinase
MRDETLTAIGIGRCIGGYRIDALIGVGGMGRVYRAWDQQRRRRVAIKVVDDRGAGAGHASWLIHEARLGAALCHPSICAIHGIGYAGTQPFIVMEHVRGIPLAALIPEGAGLPLMTSVRYAAQIVDAVAHAHARGVVHRDLKSSNVMIAAGGRAKLLDFGLAIRRDPGVDVSELQTTSSGDSPSGAGTVPYMAPELLRGGPADERSDIWALGVLIYEMLTGRRPFRGGTRYEVGAAILSDPISPLPAMLPDWLAAAVAWSLTKDPAARCRSARDLGAALHRGSRWGAPRETRPDGRLPQWTVRKTLSAGERS